MNSNIQLNVRLLDLQRFSGAEMFHSIDTVEQCAKDFCVLGKALYQIADNGWATAVDLVRVGHPAALRTEAARRAADRDFVAVTYTRSWNPAQQP